MRKIESGKNMARRVVEHLHGILQERGYGAISWLERGLGVASGWWAKRLRTGDIRFSGFIGVTRLLGLNAARVIAKIIGTPLTARHRPAGEPPWIVRLANERLAAEAHDLAVPPEPPPPGRDDSLLELLDRKSFQDPRRAVELGEEAVLLVDSRLLPRVLGIVGSAYRRADAQLREAEHCLQAALDVAEEPLVRADLLQRLAYVVRDQGEYAEALGVAEKASVIYVDAGDLARIGQTCVDRGIFSYHLGHLPQAIAAQRAALGYLPESEVKHRFGAYQVLGLCHRERGELEQAAAYAREALALLPALDHGAWPKAKLLWLLAEIAADLEQLEEAELKFREAVELFRPLHDGETALATIGLVRVQILRGRPTVALETAQSMRALVWNSDNRIIAAALAELLHVEQAAALTLAVVEQARDQLEKARGRPEWRFLRT